MADFQLSVDNDTLKAFNAAYKEASLYYTRLPSDTCNHTLYYVASAACTTTPATTKEKIRDAFMQPSKIAPDAPLMAILVNRKRGQEGKPGLEGAPMADEVEKQIRIKQSHRNSLRVGYMPARKALAAVLTNKSGAPKIPSGIRQRGKPKGGAQPARPTANTGGGIFNTMEGNHNQALVNEMERKGLDDAVKQETGSKLQYILRKKVEEGYLILNGK